MDPREAEYVTWLPWSFEPKPSFESDDPLPRGVSTFPVQDEAPSRVKTAMAIMAPAHARSRIKPRRAKIFFPPRKQVRRTAKMVYSTTPPAMPVTACCQTGMETLRSAWTARKYE